GATRLGTTSSITTGTNSAFETSAYIKGDSLIVMAIDTTKNAVDLKLTLPYKVKSGIHLLSTGNETENLCQEKPITIDEPTREVTVEMPARSLNTYIFMIDQASAAIEDVRLTNDAGAKVYYDLQGRKLVEPHGVCVEKSANGSSRIVFL
ncbi:MAG: hypothetical protein IKX24_02690, partial [Prevotella sp.]|nr:hypothetical protein [Prevotella sp.]